MAGDADRDPRAAGRVPRRTILRLAALAPIGGIVGSGCAEEGALRLGPWPCRPSANAMAVWLEARPDEVTRIVATDPTGRSFDGTVRPLDDRFALAEFIGLDPDTRYAFAVRRRGGPTDWGVFRTMPTESGIVDLAFGADIHPASKPYRAFAALAERAPHLYVGLGDQIYADLDDPAPDDISFEAYESRYRRTWDDADLRRAWSEVATLLVWDDHEVWNDYDGSFAFDRIDAAHAAYEIFQRGRAPSPTAWSIVDAGPASVFVLDTRSFRSPNASPNGPSKTMLGAAQKAALLDWLASSPAKVRIVASPTAFHAYADTGIDTWAFGFPDERAELFAAFAANDPATLVLVSGDLHWPSVVEHTVAPGTTLLELGCTPTAAFPRARPIAVGPDVLYVDSDVRGFGLLRIDGTGASPSVSFAFVDELGTERFRITRP